MANLNFQQPPRIPSASLSGRSTGGFNTSISGNVTPTSSLMFPSAPNNNSNYVTPGQQQQQQQQQQNHQNQQQQLSPNRNAQLAAIGGGSSSIVGPPMGNSARRMYGPTLQQRDDFASRRMPGLGGGSMSNMGSFMQSRGYGSQSGNSIANFQNVFANSNDTGTPPTLLDMSEFPSLTNARSGGGHNDQSLAQSNVLQPGSKPYVGMVKQPTSEQTEFQMSSEDFPALPGTDSGVGVVGGGSVNHNQHNLTSSAVSSVSSVISANNIIGPGNVGMHHGGMSAMGMSMSDNMNMMDNKNSIGSNLCMDMMQSETVTGGNNVSGGIVVGGNGQHMNNSEKAKRGVQTSPNGLVTNIPATMVNNQFGMIGLLTFIRAAESDPNLVSLAMGQDLTALGLNLNSMENLYQSFGGPFSDSPARPQDIDYPVPAEYMINVAIRDKLATMKMKQYKDDLLFFLFYTNVGDVMQIAAANELYQREWRYHMEEKIWITRVPGHTPTTYDKSGSIERGTYYYFDAQNWRRVPKEFQIDTQKLDTKPPINLS